MRGLLEEPDDQSTVIGGTVVGGTTGSVLFINPSNILAQDNANFNYNSSSHIFTVGARIDAAVDATYDIGQNGSNRFKDLYLSNSVRCPSGLFTTQVQSGSTGYFFFQSSTSMHNRSDGVMTISNFAENDFGRLQFGGTTSSFPSLKRSTTGIQFRLADDSGNALINPTIATLLGKQTAGGNAQVINIGHNGTTTSSNDGTYQIRFNSQFDNYPFSMGAEGNGYNFYFRQTNGGQGTFAFNFGTISTVAYQNEYTYVTDHYENILTGKWLLSYSGSGNAGAYYGVNNTIFANSTSTLFDTYRVQRTISNGYYPQSNDPLVSFFNGSSTATVTEHNKYVARINRLGFLGIQTTNTYAAPNTMIQAAITVDMGSKTGLKTTDGTTALQVKTVGTSTSVVCVGNVNGENALGLIVGSKITANGLTRTITALTSAQGFTVDTAVDWSNGGAGYNFTYTNPYISLQDGATKYFQVAANGDTSIGGNLIASGTTSIVRLKGYTVATLPTGVQGDTAFVTDANATTFNSVVAGGGANVMKVFHNGTNWVIQ